MIPLIYAIHSSIGYYDLEVYTYHTIRFHERSEFNDLTYGAYVLTYPGEFNVACDTFTTDELFVKETSKLCFEIFESSIGFYLNRYYVLSDRFSFDNDKSKKIKAYDCAYTVMEKMSDDNLLFLS